MARKATKPNRPGEPSLLDKVTAITITVGDGTPSPAQFSKMLGLFAEGARAGEAMFWKDVSAKTAEIPTDAPAALLMLALYTKLAMEAKGEHIPEETDISPEEVVPVMQTILVLPGWEPSARWPFSKAEMAQDLHRLGPYLIDNMDKVSQATRIVGKMN